LYKYQFGFRKDYSTTLAVIDGIDDFVSANEEVTYGVHKDHSDELTWQVHIGALPSYLHGSMRNLPWRHSPCQISQCIAPMKQKTQSPNE